MSREEMINLQPGDSIIHKNGVSPYTVVSNYGDMATAIAIKITNITNPSEWDLVSKVTKCL